MGKGSRASDIEDKIITWSEVQKHDKRDDKWIVIENKVYDVTQWVNKHPGGSRIIGHYAGQDATEAFREFHKNKGFVSKYMVPICIGKVNEYKSNKIDELAMKKDFELLRKKAEELDLFRPSKVFYGMVLSQLFLFEILAYLTIYYYGTGWIPWTISILLNVVVQAQSGWVQHDFGHFSVFESSKWNRRFHYFIMSFLKGASCSWWQHMHNQHHSKPNVINKDPDTRVEKLFVLGEVMPIRIAEEHNSPMPYNWQHRYFFLIGPPLLYPVYFQFMVFRHPISRGYWKEILCMLMFYGKFFFLYTPFLGFFGAVAYYFIVRCLESHWFVWVSQSNHIPMDIDDDKERPWLSLQLNATCDVEKSAFNDWFTGHLNFQIEHHCFPTMPRHNLYKISPYVKELCAKHSIKYKCKTLFEAFNDIVKSLKHSGEIWGAHYHLDKVD